MMQLRNVPQILGHIWASLIFSIAYRSTPLNVVFVRHNIGTGNNLVNNAINGFARLMTNAG